MVLLTRVETLHKQIFSVIYWLITQKLICFAGNNKPRGLLFVKIYHNTLK